MFGKQSLTDLVQDQLLEAQRNLLDAQAAKEFAEARVAAYSAKVRRLRLFLAGDEGLPDDPP